MTTMLGVSLTGRDVLFAGGGSLTARRLPRLIAEGAAIRIVSPSLSEETAELVRRHDLAWTAREALPADVEGAWLVHAATGDARTDADVAAWCEQRRTFCVNASDGAHGSARLTAETAGIVSAERIGLMRPGSYLVNAARGPLMDYVAVGDALESGQLAGVALDVYPTEPVDFSHRLFGLLAQGANLVLTPHIAGASQDVARRAAAIVAADLARFVRGEPLRHRIA